MNEPFAKVAKVIFAKGLNDELILKLTCSFMQNVADAATGWAMGAFRSFESPVSQFIGETFH